MALRSPACVEAGASPSPPGCGCARPASKTANPVAFPATESGSRGVGQPRAEDTGRAAWHPRKPGISLPWKPHLRLPSPLFSFLPAVVPDPTPQTLLVWKGNFAFGPVGSTPCRGHPGGAAVSFSSKPVSPPVKWGQIPLTGLGEVGGRTDEETSSGACTARPLGPRLRNGAQGGVRQERPSVAID